MKTAHQTERRVAFITGAATGLGRAFAQRLARDGADIVIADVDDAEETVRLVSKEGRRALAVRCDVSDEHQVAAAVTAATEEFGGVHILVSNAGVYPHADLATLSLAEWRRVFAVNVDGAFLVTRALLPPMRDRGWGRIVFLTSTSFHLGSPGFPHYVASKGALIGFMHAVASVASGDGVTVNAIAPSIVLTEGTRREASQEAFDRTRRLQAISRTQQPEDVVGTLSFLASHDAAFLTGQTIVVDGGLVRT